MSSCTPSRPDRRAVSLTVLVFVTCAVQWLAATGAAATQIVVVAVLPPADHNVSLAVDVHSEAEPVSSESLSVIVDGVRQPSSAVPVISDQLLAGLVVDASQSGSRQLQAWLSGATRFVLEAPATGRIAVVADTTPPTVVAPLQQGAQGVLDALTAVQPRGERRTSDALSLVVRQLPNSSTRPRVLVLYTSAPDAGGETATHLAERLTKAHALLVVITTAADTQYWSRATRATGGVLAPALPSTVERAFDQVAIALRARYLLTIPTPTRLPAQVSVQVDTGAETLAADAVIPALRGSGSDGRGLGGAGSLWLLLIAGVLVTVIAALLVEPYVAAFNTRRRDRS
jgi:hypothetical protein